MEQFDAEKDVDQGGKAQVGTGRVPGRGESEVCTSTPVPTRGLTSFREGLL